MLQSSFMRSSSNSCYQVEAFTIIEITPMIRTTSIITGGARRRICTCRSIQILTSSTSSSQTTRTVNERSKPKPYRYRCDDCSSGLQAGLLDDFINGNLNLFNNNKNKNTNKYKYDNESNESNERIDIDSNVEITKSDCEEADETLTLSWNESDFQKEVQKRTETPDDNNNAEEYDGYALRDAIYEKWGKCYDIDFQPVNSFGFRELYLNVLPFHLGGKRFRHDTEMDYLCHLQAVVEILVKYDQLEYVLSQLEETKKKPRAGTSPLVAVPFRLDLTEDELNSILN